MSWLVTSDHGFVELRINAVSRLIPGRPRPGFLSISVRHRASAGIIVPYSGKKGASSVTVLVGRAWFTREKGAIPAMLMAAFISRKWLSQRCAAQLEAPEAIRL